MGQQKGFKNGLSKIKLKQALKATGASPKKDKPKKADIHSQADDPVWRTIKKNSAPVKQSDTAYNPFRDFDDLIATPPLTVKNPVAHSVRPKDLAFKAADWAIGEASSAKKSRATGSNPSLVNSLATGKLVDMDRATADRFRRGKLPIEGRLDLHGMTQDEAVGHLSRFIAFNAHQGKRCLIIVTGKGDPRKGGGVLKRQVPEWLSLSPNREKILAVSKAQPKDGGGGALYVLLKRLRS